MNQKINSRKVDDSLEKLILAQRSLDEAISLPIKNKRDMAGIIKNFEFVFELSWKTLKRLLEVLGHEALSARDTFKIAYKTGLIENGNLWLEIIDSRNLTSHTYDEKIAKLLVEKIKTKYAEEFLLLTKTVTKKLKEIR